MSTQDQLYKQLLEQNPKITARQRKLIECRNTRISFANDHHFIKGKNLDFVEYPYLVELYNSLAKEIVISGGTQIGKSVLLSVYIMACMTQGLHVFAVWPRKSDKEAFMKTNLKKIIQDSPFYSKMAANTPSASDSVDLMFFGPGKIKAASAETDRDFVQFDADVYVVDEADHCDAERLKSGHQRYDNSYYQFKLWISNPQFAGSPIVKALENSTYKQWQVECESCGEFSDLDFFKVVINQVKDEKGNVVSHALRDKSWKKGCGRDIHLKCPHCETGNLDRQSPNNHWLATQPEKDVEGYHMPSLISLRRDVSFIYNEYLTALKENSMGVFYTTKLGLPYESKTGGLSLNIMERCSTGTKFNIDEGNCAYRVKEHAGPCTMGIDTRGVLDVRISSIGEGNRRVAELIGKYSALDEDVLLRLCRDYNVKYACIDIGPESVLAQKFQRIAIETGLLTVYRVNYKGKGREREMMIDDVKGILTVDRTQCMETTRHHLTMGMNVLPENTADLIEGNYLKEMTAVYDTLIPQTDGTSVKKFLANGDDHQFHACGYDRLAFKIMTEHSLSVNDLYIGSGG